MGLFQSEQQLVIPRFKLANPRAQLRYAIPIIRNARRSVVGSIPGVICLVIENCQLPEEEGDNRNGCLNR
ncbi:hypothetical protein B5C34_07675 [Pacificimonas flava]|uniref:Uncharacterized protein n=1 Tax=Pacificimonas flava TaxID=1234595 RepID=A0A219B5G1_9SPHN|nr:hypothetical protein B5C34_07675 [Pacificimonas flava]